MTADERAIHELIATWFAATKSGDVETVLRLMTDDVIFMVPGREPFGKQEFADSARALMDTRFDGLSEIRELKIMGGWAYLRNHIDVTSTAAGSAPVHRDGYTLTILRKEADGQWRLARDANLLSSTP